MLSWFNLFVFTVLCYSVSNHFVYAHGPFHMYDKIRDLASRTSETLGELFQCMICFPFWVGLLLSLIDTFFIGGEPFTPFNVVDTYSDMPWWLVSFFDAMFASGAVWLIHTLQEAIERTNQEANNYDG